MTTKHRVLFWLLIFSLLCPCAFRAAADAQQHLLLVPSRYTIVQLAFDLARLRPMHLVTYDRGADPDSPLLYVWDPETENWVRTTVDEFASGSVFRSMPRRIIIVGGQYDVPSPVLAAAGRAEQIDRVPSLGIVQIINAVDKQMDFSPEEWQWLARRYRLKLKDRNEERRRYGRYGPPGTKGQRRPYSYRSEREAAPMPQPRPQPRPVITRVAPAEVQLDADAVWEPEDAAPEPLLETEEPTQELEGAPEDK